MEWPGFIALIALLLVTRLIVLQRAFLGIGSLGQLLFDVGLALFVFGSTFVRAEFFLRAFGGEMDSPASRGYRRRP